MFEILKAMKTAASGMGAQSLRLRIVGENIANADTAGFQRKTVSFESEVDRALGVNRVVPGPVRLDERPVRETYSPGHPLADERGILALSNVDPLVEIADAREAQRSYQANLTIFDQARRMASGTLDLLRR